MNPKTATQTARTPPAKHKRFDPQDNGVATQGKPKPLPLRPFRGLFQVGIHRGPDSIRLVVGSDSMFPRQSSHKPLDFRLVGIRTAPNSALDLLRGRENHVHARLCRC